MRTFDWEDLRYFIALARTLHLGNAAALLKTSQVTVMRRVKALEVSLGVTLFVRRRDGHRLTQAGTALLVVAGEAEHVLDSVVQAVGDVDTQNRGRVRIATTEVGANWILLPRISEFCSQHPNITLEIDASPQAMDLIEDTETLALRFRRPEAGAFTVKNLGTMQYGVYATPAFLNTALACEATTAFPEQLSYIGWTGQFAEISLARWLRSVFKGQLPRLTLTTLHGQIEAARLGIGAIGLPTFIGKQFKDLVEVPEPSEPFNLDVWIVIPSQARKIARIKTTARFIEDAVRQAIQNPSIS